MSSRARAERRAGPPRAGRPAAGVVVNASVVGDEPTGLGLYAIRLVRELARIRTDLSVYTSSPDAFGRVEARLVPIAPRVRPERGMLGHAARLAWTQLSLPV